MYTYCLSQQLSLNLKKKCKTKLVHSGLILVNTLKGENNPNVCQWEKWMDRLGLVTLTEYHQAVQEEWMSDRHNMQLCVNEARQARVPALWFHLDEVREQEKTF